MASDARFGRKNKDNQSNNKLSDKGSASGKTERSSLRKSVGEAKQVASAITRKSERLEKQSLSTSTSTSTSTPTVNRKSGAIEKKQNTPSPLRRSDRGKKHTPSSSLRSSYLGRESNSSSVKKEKKEKSVKELIMESESVSTSRKNDLPSVGLKRKIMDARSYKALFEMQRKRFTELEINEKLQRPKKSARVDSTASDDINSKLIDVDSESHGRVVKESTEENPDAVGFARSISSLEDADASGNDVKELPYSRGRCYSAEKFAALSAENGLEVSKNGCTDREISRDSERVREGCFVTEDNLQIPEFACSTSAGGDVILKSGQQCINKSSEMRKNTCDLADVSPLPPLADNEKLGFGGTCVSCCRQIRADHDSPEEELCSCAGISGRDYSNLPSLKDRVCSEPAILLDSGGGCNTQLNEGPSVSQRDGDKNMCAICKQAGEILICDGRGCRRCYHLSCLDPPLDDFPPGTWHCTWCTKKKIESGVHSVTEGLQSIVDVREVEVAGAKGMHRQKQYLVKYQRLAHAHNHWVAETQLLIATPLLIADYNHMSQDVRWNSEWTVPHRLLKKRSLMFSKLHGEDADDNTKCLFEWLVKWRGLDYKYSTWELGNANFLNSQHGKSLIEDFNIRRKKAKQRIDKGHKGPFVKLSELSAGGSLITDSNLLNNVNKLRECWLKCQNTAVFDDQDRILKMVLFILSLSDVSWPFLIVTTSSSLFQWEAEFARCAPSIDVVVYRGSKESRRRIKSLEFYDEGGFVMLQVLLSSLEAVIEDVEILSCLSWEVIIVDDCQNSGISAAVEQIKMLATGVRVLLFNGPMKIISSESLNLLSLLDCKVGLDKTGGLESDFNDHLGKLKGGLSKVTAPCGRPESSKFVEYWVPVQISELQLEQYCATLLTNGDALRSFYKSDPVGALRNILLTVRKCCDHPYILDPSLQPFNRGLSHTEILEVGIKVSGKLQLLDKMVSEMKLRQRRVVVLFQSIVGSAASIGDILDDFLRQRFGENSYERVEMCVILSKRQASINRFNNMESGRFVLLLENRACHPSIKLLSVDSVIIYDSEMNPTNDLRLLQRISINSESKHTNVFRLYSCFTVEERALVLAKQDLNLDNNLHSTSRSPNNTLMWGASNLFCRLDEYHSVGSLTSISANSSGQLLLDNVISEFSAIISQSCDYKDSCDSIISKVHMSMGTYSANIPLLGEKKMELKIGEEPHAFWRKILEGRSPQWRNLSIATPRNRKRIQYVDGSPGPPNGNDGVGKKRRKVVNHSVDSIPTHVSPERGEVADTKGGAHENDDVGREHVSRSPSHPLSEVDVVEPQEGQILCHEQKKLHMHLKAEFAKLFEVLKLPDDVKHTVGKFLEYVMENHRVSREPSTILQAFQISLCWVAASILEQKIDKEETFLLAKQHLQLGCTKEEANKVYKKIRSLKKTFLQALDQNNKASNSSKCSLLAVRSVAVEPSKGSMSQAVESSGPNMKTEMEERLPVKKISGECIWMSKEKLVDIERENFIKEVQYRCDRRLSKLVQKQEEEIEEFQKIWEKKKEELEEDYRLQLAVLRSIYGQTAAIKDRQKTLETEFSSKMKELKCCKDQHLKELEGKHTAMKNKEMQKAASWLAEANSFRDLGSDSTDDLRCFLDNVNVSHNSSKNFRAVSEQHVEEVNAGNIVDSTRCNLVASDLPASTSEESNILPIESTNVLATPATEELLGIMPVDDGALVARSKQAYGVGDPDVPASTSNESNILPFEITNVLTIPVTEEQVEIVSTVASFVARSELPNEVGYSGGISEEIGALVSRSNQPNGVGDLDVPASTSHESNIHVETSNVLMTPVTEEQFEIASAAGAMVVRSKLTNEVGDSGGSPEEIVNVFPRECLSEISGTAFNVGVGNHHSDVNNVIDELNTESNSLENNFHLPNDEVNPRNVVSSTDRNNISPEELIVNLPSVARVLSDDAGFSLHNQSSGYNETLAHEMPLLENQIGREVEVDAGQFGPNNFEAVLINRSEQSQPASDGPPLAADDPQRDTVHQTHNDERNSTPNLGSSHHMGEALEHLQAGGNLEERPSVDVETSPPNTDRPNLSEDRRVDPRPITEQLASSQNTETPARVPGSAELPSQPILQTNTNVALLQGPRNIAVLPAHHMATWNSSISFNADPLHKEWERIHKEKEQSSKFYEGMKLRLRSDCEKEREEIIAQIHKKYDLKLQEAEAAFLRKKNDLDMNQNKVLMNKILADAFRCKCMNLKPSGLAGMHHVVRSSYMQHLHQVSQQPNSRSSPLTGSSSAGQQNSALACLRTSPVTGLSSAGNAQVGQETSLPSFPVNHSVHSGAISQPTYRCAPVTGLSLAGQPAPSLQTAPVSRSTTLSPGIPGRPPLISAITPCTGNLRVAGEIRAPAPHLQPFRPPTSMSANSPSMLAHGMQNQSLSTYEAASATSLPQLASVQSTSPPSQPSQHQIPPPLVPALAIDISSAVDISSSGSMTSQHDIGELPAAQNPPLCAQELLLNVDNRHHANRPSVVPPLPDMGSNFDTLDLSDFRTLDSVQGGSTPSAIATDATDVVCLSDDD